MAEPQPAELNNPIDPTIAAIIARKARRLVGRAGLQHQDRADLEQELTLRVLSQRGQYRQKKGAWAAFVHALIDRFGENLVRERLAAKRKPESLASLSDGVDVAAGGVDPGGALDVAAALDSLPPDLREVAESLMTRSITETARVLRISRATVYARIRELASRSELQRLQRDS